MNDVVYILGTGSRWNDNEIKYSVRSVQLHLKNYRIIYIIGATPRCGEIEGVSLVPMADPSFDKQRNARAKLLRACVHKGVTDNIVLMNDDFFFLRETDAKKIPLYRQGMLAEHIAWREARSETPTRYQQSLQRTFDTLKKHRLPTGDFEVHTPIVYNRAKLLKVLTDEFDWAGSPAPLTRSLYANWCKEPGELLSDCKIDTALTLAEITRRNKKRNFFSIGDSAVNPHMEKYLSEL